MNPEQESAGTITLPIEPEEKREFHIIVNTRPKTVLDELLTFDEVVLLAFPTPPGPNIVYTVTYRHAAGPKPDGTLVEGQTVKIKDGTIFNVTPTSKS